MSAGRSITFARDRRCERCERLFWATEKDVKAQEYKCRECRSIPEPKVEITKGERSSWGKIQDKRGKGFLQ